MALVLIVEDDLATRVWYREVLAEAGFETADAHNGHQALDKVHAVRPDVVLTDLAVPGIDGFTFCRELRRAPATSGIPVLAVTGHSEYLDEPRRIHAAGIDQVIIKPCPPEVLVAELRQLLASGPHVPPDSPSASRRAI